MCYQFEFNTLIFMVIQQSAVYVYSLQEIEVKVKSENS